MRAMTVLCAAAVFAGCVQAAHAAPYVISSSPIDVDITKASGGSTFANGMLLNGMDRTVAAEFANYTQLKFDVQASTTTWAADGNFGIAWNTDSGGSWAYNQLGEQWLWSGWNGTITYDYSANPAFQNSVAAYASGNGTWWQFFAESNWPNYDGTNHYTVSQVYLDGAVPEPAALATLGLACTGLMLRRRKK